MRETKFTLQELLDWCDKKAAEGKQLDIVWDGGGDSGWVHFEIDEEDCTEPEAEELVDMMYDLLDYGSWAGEFFASGTATYDAETKTFEGIDSYSETEGTSCEAEIVIRVPKSLPFTMLNIRTQDENVDVDANFFITNGFVHPDYTKIQNELNESLQSEFSEAIDKDLDKTSQEFDSCWHNYEIPREQFEVDGDDLVHTIKQVHYTFHCHTDRDMSINLAELLEEEEEENGL
jgi:hypothetical protein